LKEKEESLVKRLEPLQESATILTQVVEKKKEKVVELLKVAEGKLEEPLSEQLVEEMKGQGNKVTTTVATCQKHYEKIQREVQKVKDQA